jgi:hypothetical protein
MNTPLQNRFEIQIKALQGFDFQDFIIELFLQKYGAKGFTVLRQKKDKGCDGIINAEKQVIACYGPVSNNQNKFDQKVNEDFEDYQNNWQSSFPNWMFIVNQDVTPLQVSKIKSLKSDAPLLGIKQIISIIYELKNHQRRKIADYLNIEQSFLASDYLGDVLEDLLMGSEVTTESIKYDKIGRIYIEDKIVINYSESEVEDAVNEYVLLAESGSLKDVSDLLSAYEDEEISRLKHKILIDYASTNGTFKERLNQLSKFYTVKYASENDDDYLHYIRAVLIYLFEQCLIGRKKTSAE